MKWTRKHQNLTSASVNFVSRSSVSKEKQDLPVSKEQRQRRLQLWVKGFSFAVKPKNLARQVVAGWRNKPGITEAIQTSSEVPADVSLKQRNKRLAGCWIKAKVMLAAGLENDSNNYIDAASDKSIYTTINFVFRNDVNED